MKNSLMLLLLLPLSVFCQLERTELLTDSSIAVGIVNEDCFAGPSVTNYCSSGIDKYFLKKTTVLVSGVTTCKKTYSAEEIQFFEIVYKDKTFYIERDKLSTLKGTYEQIKIMSPETAEAFRKNAQSVSERLHQSTVRKGLKFLENCKPKGLAILDWNIFDESEHTEGTGIKFKVYNPTAKTIKYAWFTFVGLNPVGDKVTDRRRGTSTITVQGVGPIKPEGVSEWEFTYTWFTDLVETARITSIKVQYMDNSVKIISNPKEIMMPGELYNIIFEED